MTQAAPQTAAAPALALGDIRQLVTQDFPPLSQQIAPTAAATLGTFTSLRGWLANTQGKTAPDIRHPRIALFLSAYGAYADAQQDLHDLPAQLAKPAHPLAQMAALSNADLQVYELDLATASADYRSGTPALSEADALQAVSYGMMAVQPGIDFLILTLSNPAAAQIAQDLRAALAQGQDPLAALLHYGGFDMAAALGAAVAARLAKTPVLLDDSAAIIADILHTLAPDAAAHIRLATDVLPQDMTAAAGIRSALALPLLQALCKAA